MFLQTPHDESFKIGTLQRPQMESGSLHWKEQKTQCLGNHFGAFTSVKSQQY